MNKTIKSEVRKLLFCMISKYEEKKLVKQAVFREKQDCLRTVTDFLDSLEDNARTAEVKQAIEKITDLDQKDMIKSQNQYLEELSSLTDVSVITLKRIKKEGALNEGVWRTPARREYDDLQRRHNILQEERNHLSNELRERERELSKLKNVSEKLFQEYQQLKNQHEVDSGVMQKVMQQAGEWYKQNKQLKRRSTALLQALPAKSIDIDFTDSNDAASDSSSNEEVEFLKQTVSELGRQLAALQTELGAARLHEFEAHETNVALAQELETCQAKCSGQETELEQLRGAMERHHRVSKLLMEEVTALKNNADDDRQRAETYKSEARAAASRVKQLTHQSTLLLGELELDERLMLLLREVEALKAALHDQDHRHRDQLEDLQLKLAEKHEDTDILLWEEKIKLAEEDAQKAVERAERAERKLDEAKQKLDEMKIKVDETERKVGEAERKLTDAQQKLTTTDKKLIETEIKLTETEKRAEDRRTPKKSNLMSRISYFENGANEKKEEKKEEIKEIKEEAVEVEDVQEVAAPLQPPITTTPSPPPPAAPAALPPPPPPPPAPPSCPPPPPPPPPPAVFSPCGDDMATMLANKQGTLRRSKQNGEAQGGAIDAIVDQIKGGKFQLKSTDQNFLEKKPKDDQPEAVKEMLAILGTLRKRRSVTRPSFVASDT